MKATRHPHWPLVAGILALLACFAAVVPVAEAQGRVEAELRRTDRILHEAQGVVAEALGDRPMEILQQAFRIQEEAWDSFRNGRYVEAGHRTGVARKGALRAIELAKAQRRLLDRVQQLHAENVDLVARARDAVRKSQKPEAARLFEAGKKQLERGERAFHHREYRPAVRHSLFGRDLLLRAIRVAEGGPALSLERVTEEVRRTDEFLREAEQSMEDRSASGGALADARRLQDEARSSLSARRLRNARQLTLRAREVTLEALRDDGAMPSQEDARALLERVAARYGDLRSEARGVDDAELARLFKQVEAHLDEGRHALRENDTRRAFVEAQLASTLLGRANDRLR